MKLIGIAIVGVLAWDYFTGAIGIFRMLGMGAGSSPSPLPNGNQGNSVLPGAVPTGPGATGQPPMGQASTGPLPGVPQARPGETPAPSSTSSSPYAPPPAPAHATQPEYVNRVEQFRQAESTNPAYYQQRLIAAAKGEAGSVDLVSAAGVKFNADQWNWFRSQDGGQITSVDLFPEGNRDYQMTISEYLQRRDSAGLTGLSEMARRHPRLYLM